MNLNKLTKAELINKLTKAEVQKGKLEPKIEQLNTAYEDYNIDYSTLKFNLYFKHKIVKLSHKEF